ncbi:hypothetical protein DLAC_05360 [Tieghemostelium lacteum]|uniref:Apoptosis inhibitor 5 n=1 Tax=Tieghemostelium lacteum TaxID=361077 RepID=A0A151ZFM9_TIELA|nr:hypothetical protein DLAC_05360 [Tieghemostelium lacteum]|eukprot:KYQ92781.1 hypothetical protein DLAC_05360 [Tieghemostelium lacteum]
MSTSTSTSTSTDSQIISKFYEYAEKLEANPTFQGDLELYNEILSLSQRSNQTKRLTPQFVSKFFKRFPTVQEKSVDCIIDLFESEEVAVRIGAIKSVSDICQQDPKLISRMVDILSQILNTDSKVETDCILTTIQAIYKINSLNTLDGMLTFLESLEEQSINKTLLIKLIQTELLPSIKSEYIKSTPEIETIFRNRIFGLLVLFTSKNESSTLFQFFDCFPNYQLKDLVQLVELYLPKIPQDISVKDGVNRALGYLRILTHRTELISNHMKQSVIGEQPVPTGLYQFMLKRVFSVWDQIEDALIKTEILSLFAQVSILIPIQEIREFIEPLYKIFTIYAPLQLEENADLDFVALESLLYSLAALCSKSISSTKILGYTTITGQPSDMSQEVNKERLVDFQSRLRLLNAKSKETAIKVKKSIDQLKKEDATKQFLKKSYKAIQNISLLSQCFLQNQPTYSIQNMVLSSIKKQHKLKFKSFSPSQSPSLQSNKPQSPSESKAKENRYKPYVPPDRREDSNKNNNNNNNKNNNQGGKQNKNNKQQGGGVKLNIETEKKNKPSHFKGRGDKNF